MPNKTLREYIDLIKEAENSVITEWMDPGPPCTVCGKPQGSHRVKFTRKNPSLKFFNPDDSIRDLEMSNAEDHEYSPTDNYRPLTQKEAQLVGTDILSRPSTPDNIYDLIEKARKRGKTEKAKLFRVK